MSRRASTVTLLVAWAAGCQDLRDDQRLGELGRGAFAYECIDDTDIACSDGPPSAFPDGIAVGSAFRLDFDGFDGGAASVLDPVSPSLARREGGNLRARGPGVVAILARELGDERVLDFVHVALAAPSALSLQATADFDGAFPLGVLRPGEPARVTALLLSSTGFPLAGARERYEWSTSDPTILTLIGDTAGPRARIRAQRVGTATIVARSGDFEGEIDVAVEAWPDAGAPPADVDAGEDADAGR